MRKVRTILAVCCLLICVCLVLGGCGSGDAETPKAGNQEQFLKDMAKGIDTRLKYSAQDTSKMTMEEVLTYYNKLVSFELDCIAKYENQTFADEEFNTLAHLYIAACNTQLEATENFTSQELFSTVWDGALAVREEVVVTLYEEYGLPITAEQADVYRGTTTTSQSTEVTEAITIEETVVYNVDGVIVTATGYEEGQMGPQITFLVENNTDKSLRISGRSISANGFMMPTAYLSVEVAAGKKANETMTLWSSEIEQAGIETISRLQFYIEVSEAGTYTHGDKSELITLDTSATDYVQPIENTGDVIYDANGIRVVCKGLRQDRIWDGAVVFFIENESGQEISVRAEDVSVNNFMQDVSLWSSLRDGTMIVDSMSLLDLSDLNLDSLDDIENIEFVLNITNGETMKKIDKTDVIRLEF